LVVCQVNLVVCANAQATQFSGLSFSFSSNSIRSSK
jgi:hypothetical protein